MLVYYKFNLIKIIQISVFDNKFEILGEYRLNHFEGINGIFYDQYKGLIGGYFSSDKLVS